MFPLETERLLLRPFTKLDVGTIYALVYADSRVREAWSGHNGTLQAFRLRFVIDQVWRAHDGFGYLAVVLQETRRLLGLMGFQRYRPGEDTSFVQLEGPADEIGRDPALVEVELTYALGYAYWGHGYATEAGQALIGAGFRHLGIDRIVNAVPVHPDHRSLALLNRLGFRIVPNLQPVTSGVFAGAPGAVGILTKAAWEAQGKV
jgi:RimJ/RimL family protein N-acetyltransferase